MTTEALAPERAPSATRTVPGNAAHQSFDDLLIDIRARSVDHRAPLGGADEVQTEVEDKRRGPDVQRHTVVKCFSCSTELCS